jgi:hypothetical protein
VRTAYSEDVGWWLYIVFGVEHAFGLSDGYAEGDPFARVRGGGGGGGGVDAMVGEPGVDCVDGMRVGSEEWVDLGFG